jgi:hypothetical protein
MLRKSLKRVMPLEDNDPFAQLIARFDEPVSDVTDK